MGKNVFANGMEVSCKKNDNKSMAAMADVCLSPPSPPAGPVPIPYPNTAMGSDTSGGSRSVKIGGDEVGIKNASDYKKSTGDEAATKTLGMGVVSHNIQGKLKHTAWSFDVKIEGANALRHMDLTTHNHINQDNVALTLNQAAQANAQTRELSCEELNAANAEMRSNEAKKSFTGGAVTNAYRGPGTGPALSSAPGGRYLKAMCPNLPKAEFSKGYADSVEDKNQPPCAGGRATSSGRRNDAENKILVPEMKARVPGTPGGKIKLSTWHSPGDAAPCYSCRQSICEAEQCGIEVWLCKSEKTPPEAVRPAAQGLCPPASGQGDYDPAWQSQGLGPWP